MTAEPPRRPPSPPDQVLVALPRWVSAIVDRGIQAIIVLVVAAAGGFAAIGLAWSGAAARPDVAGQLPFVVSGAFGGIALSAAFLAIAAIHIDRRHNASERVHTERAIRDFARLADRLPAAIGRHQPQPAPTPISPPPALVRNGRTAHLADCRIAAGRDLPLLDAASADTATLRACRICQPRLDNQRDAR